MRTSGEQILIDQRPQFTAVTHIGLIQFNSLIFAKMSSARSDRRLRLAAAIQFAASGIDTLSHSRSGGRSFATEGSLRRERRRSFLGSDTFRNRPRSGREGHAAAVGSVSSRTSVSLPDKSNRPVAPTRSWVRGWAGRKHPRTGLWLLSIPFWILPWQKHCGWRYAYPGNRGRCHPD